MFTTHRHAEIPLAALSGEPFQLWRTVELEQNRPWFCVTLNIGKGKANWRTTYLLASESELERMLHDVGPKARVEAVQVVTPSHLNGSGMWQMEALAELVRISDKNENVLGYALKTSSGIIYSDGTDLNSANVDRAHIYCCKTKPHLS